MTRDFSGCDYDIAEARSLLRDYRASLSLCRDGALLKEQLVKLNLRAFAIGLCLNPDSQLSVDFHQVVSLTSERFEQGGLFANMKEAPNLQHWIDFLTQLANPTPDMLAAMPACQVHPLL